MYRVSAKVNTKFSNSPHQPRGRERAKSEDGQVKMEIERRKKTAHRMPNVQRKACMCNTDLRHPNKEMQQLSGRLCFELDIEAILHPPSEHHSK